MTRFSKIFSLNRSQAELDFVDISPGSDTPLYIDPYALTTREDTWSVDCHALVVSYFNEVLRAVKDGDRDRGIQLLIHLSEPEETHLGVSKDGNKGRGIGRVQAEELYGALARSRASQTGLLEDLSDFALFIPGIGTDKVSDITTNVIRKPLIEYTQAQCLLHNIPMRSVPSGFFWCFDNLEWRQEYVMLPVCDTGQVILVPKYMVRYQVGVDHTRYRNMFVLEFLKRVHLRADDSLVTVLRDKKGKLKRKIVYKKTVDKHYPKDKEFLTEFSISHPEIIDRYRESLKRSATKIPDINGREFDEGLLASAMRDELSTISPGGKDAHKYHAYCFGLISFLFFPNLIYPVNEGVINEGRKRIDIKCTNGKDSGLFFRIALDQHLKANTIHIECKNYAVELGNPEIDQLIGRFDNNRGRFGIVLFRSSDNIAMVKQRCRDAARQGLGVILPIDDQFIINCLNLIEQGERRRIDFFLDQLYQEVIS